MTSYTEQFQLKGKVALVTGAAQGIGAEVVTVWWRREINYDPPSPFTPGVQP